MRLEVPIGSLILFCLVACALEEEPADDGVGGVGGATAGSSSGKGGTSAGKGGSSSAGTAPGGSTSGGSGTAGKGSAGATAGTNASGSGGTTTAGTGGTSAGGPAAGTSAGGSNPVGGSAGAGGSAGGVGGTGGSVGGSSSGSSGSGGGGTPIESGLPVPPGDANQPKPSGAAGDITVVNWAGFKSAVTYSFDDANSSQISNFTTILALDVPFTWYLWTGKSESSNAVWGQARDAGHELGNHTQSHSSNGTAGDIDSAQSFIMSKWNVRAYTMAAPNGASVYTNLAKPTFIINRGVSNSVIMPNGNSDPFTLPTYIPPTGAGANDFNGQVDGARTQGGWVTMCIHGFSGGSDGAYQPVSFDGWKSSVEHAKELGDVWIGTMEDVGAYWLGQKAFGSATTMTSGSDKTWTWTLPNNFPPGKYLRVKVPGGTVKQNGAEVPWDGHGYYEIALDTKSVTVSP